MSAACANACAPAPRFTLFLAVVTTTLFFCGELLALLPWGLIWEWTFRLVGIAAFGPHMIWVGKAIREEQARYDQERKEYAKGSKKVRKDILDKYTAEYKEEVNERFTKECGERPPTEVYHCLSPSMYTPLGRVALSPGLPLEIPPPVTRGRRRSSRRRSSGLRR